MINSSREATLCPRSTPKKLWEIGALGREPRCILGPQPAVSAQFERAWFGGVDTQRAEYYELGGHMKAEGKKENWGCDKTQAPGGRRRRWGPGAPCTFLHGSPAPEPGNKPQGARVMSARGCLRPQARLWGDAASWSSSGRGATLELGEQKRKGSARQLPGICFGLGYISFGKIEE